MADFPFFKQAAVRQLGFFKFGNFNFGRPICVTVPNFAKIGRTVPEIWLIFDFSRWRPSAILDLFYACWDHPRRVFGGLCDCAKFGCNRCSNFDSMQILIFCMLSLKMPTHAPCPQKNKVFWRFYPQNVEQYERDRKRHILGFRSSKSNVLLVVDDTFRGQVLLVLDDISKRLVFGGRGLLCKWNVMGVVT